MCKQYYRVRLRPSSNQASEIIYNDLDKLKKDLIYCNLVSLSSGVDVDNIFKFKARMISMRTERSHQMMQYSRFIRDNHGYMAAGDVVFTEDNLKRLSKSLVFKILSTPTPE